jgi:hypothetical protein
VARGTLKIVPLEGQEKNHVEVFGKEIGKGEAWGSRKDLHGFLLDLGGFLGRRIVNEAKSGKDEVLTYGLSVRQDPQQRLASELGIPLDPALPKFVSVRRSHLAGHVRIGAMERRCSPWPDYPIPVSSVVGSN